MPVDIPPPETEVNMLSVIAHVIGFRLQGEGEPPLPAENARDADLLMINWIVSNTTDEDITWNFPTSDLLGLELLMMAEGGWQVIAVMPGTGGSPRLVLVPRRGTFGIPPQDEEDGQTAHDEPPAPEERAPVIPLRQIVEENTIAPDAQLAVRFRLAAVEFPYEAIFPLWR